MSAVTYEDPIMLDSTGQAIVTQLTRLANNQTYTAGDGIDISNQNVISTKVASTSQIGGVKVDGSTIVADANGVISTNISGSTFKGSILFANLPTTGMENGDWYDIKNEFTTDNRFEEGSGIDCAAGTDVIWVTDDNKWNILTPSGVYSFNGRKGAVSPATHDYDADQIDYDNTTSGLTADDVQEAIDEVVSEKADKTNIAPVESSSTASQAYSVGQQFYYNGNLYKATAAIAQNDTITVGTNCALADDITTQLSTKSTVSIAITGTASSSAIRSQKLTIDNTTTDIYGSAYMEQSVTLSTSGTTTVTFTNAAITDGKMLTFASSVWDLVPDSMTTSEGECEIVLPKASSADTIGCRLYIR